MSKYVRLTLPFQEAHDIRIVASVCWYCARSTIPPPIDCCGKSVCGDALCRAEHEREHDREWESWAEDRGES